MPEILIVHAGVHGHTAKVAARIADRLAAVGYDTDVRAVGDAEPVDLRRYAAVVAGGSIQHGRHQAELVAWARRHGRRLTAMPSAFFSVCLAVADGTAKSRAVARSWIDDFEDDTGWTPARAATFAGALAYSRYDPGTRLLMRLLMARGHHPTDTHVDVEYTDWDAVGGFADAVAELAARAPVPA